MSDPRLTPDPALITGRRPAMVAVPVADLCRSPGGARDRQLLYGDAVEVLSQSAAWSYVQAHKDGYCGHLRTQSLSPPQEATHWVHAPATHAYTRADFKSPDVATLSLGSRVAVAHQEGRFAQTSLGWIPAGHLSPVTAMRHDPAEVASAFLGTPYLWGGNSRWGIDCSGLVQAAMLACAIPCPGDSDMQEEWGAAATGPYRRNDLLLWKGHVALVTDPGTLIHANAGAMACVYEGIEDAIDRIQKQGDGPVTAHRRL